jgi:hypothetical protein
MAHIDIERHGKSYRIVWEETNISHPEGAKMVVVELTKPGYKLLWEETCQDKELAGYQQTARNFVSRL